MITAADFDGLFARVDRSGRFGPDDRHGALNFITPAVRAAALAQATGDLVISCARTIATDVGGPVELVRSVDALPDQHWSAVNEQLHVQGHGRDGTTHLDSLAHFAWKGTAHNHRVQVPLPGQPMLDVGAPAQGVLTRGFLVDLPTAVHGNRLPAGVSCPLPLLQQLLEHTDVTPRSGDALVLRMNHGSGPEIGGLSMECAEWLHDQQISLIITDAGLETEPSEVEGNLVPWHVLTLTAMGIHLVDLADLAALADVCRQRQDWTFLLTLAPAPLIGSTSALINPLAVF